MLEQQKADRSSVNDCENDGSTKTMSNAQTNRDLSRKVDEMLSRDSWVIQQLG